MGSPAAHHLFPDLTTRFPPGIVATEVSFTTPEGGLLMTASRITGQSLVRGSRLSDGEPMTPVLLV